MKSLITITLAAALMFGAVGCGSTGGGPSPATVKLLLQTAATTFESAMTLLGAKWDNAKFNADINATIAAWQIGATWKQQVINLLGPVGTDVSAIACGSNTKCQSLVVIFQGAVQSVIADLQTQQGSTKASVIKKPKYETWAAYRSDWNAVAPVNAQLPENVGE